jgi:hypothetical protein
LTFCLRTAKKEYPKSVTEFLKLEEKTFVQGVCYFINKFLNLFEKAEVNVQNIIVYSYSEEIYSKIAG